jgi:hypothetical protein
MNDASTIAFPPSVALYIFEAKSQRFYLKPRDRHKNRCVGTVRIMEGR